MPAVRKHMARFSSPLLPESLLPVGNRALRYGRRGGPTPEGQRRGRIASSPSRRSPARQGGSAQMSAPDVYVTDDDDGQRKIMKTNTVPTSATRTWKSALAQRDFRPRQLSPAAPNHREYNPYGTRRPSGTMFMTVRLSPSDAFEEKYKTSTDIDDEFREDVNLKCTSLLYYEELMYVADGDTQKASDLAGARFHIRVVNPFPGNDERRVSFDRQVRGWLKSIRRDNFEPARMVPTLERPAWNFLLPNPYPKCTDARLEYHCNRQVYRDFIETKVRACANSQAVGHPPAGHYLSGDLLYDLRRFVVFIVHGWGWWQPLATMHKSGPLLWAEPIPSACRPELRRWLHAHSDGEDCEQFWAHRPRLAIARHARLAAEMAEMERRHVRAFLLSIAEAAAHYSLADLEWALEFAFRERLRRRGIQ
ncbi:hypothetical protein DFH07DRAFT_774716 [Mycena maculata]|uniref:Uncharacterized protein n=1 Tax=Mycena maculata TaxID=230809 RepID=A0AAD7IY96_9AGAR|nr:hypothetical protein DFH07DRAFT_774716 [Mycena maculata]